VDVAEPAPPGLTINHTTGRPGSYFALAGANWPASSRVGVIINGHVFTDTVPVDDAGSFFFLLSTAGADVGWYRVTATDVGSELQARSGRTVAGATLSAAVSFTLDAGAPLRLPSGEGQTLAVPAGIALPAHRLYLPLVPQH
jgi:hypothetical protein